MTIETLKDRIEKAEAKITKKQNTIIKKQGTIAKKLDALKKFGVDYQAMNFKRMLTNELVEAGLTKDDAYDAYWLECDVGSLLEDIRRGQKEIDETAEKLVTYKAELASAEEKANSRDVQVILDFLKLWKEKVEAYYTMYFSNFLEAEKEYIKFSRSYAEWYNTNYSLRGTEEDKQKRNEQKQMQAEFNDRWSHYFPYLVRNDQGNHQLDLVKLQKDLVNEANRKYDFIIERTNAIVGQITDASELTIGDKDDLNGYIIGTKGIAKVQTIGAGGYNIQCFHFRTLINKVR